MKAWISTIAIVALCSVAFLGCSDSNRDGFVAAGTSNPSGGAGPGGGGGGSASNSGATPGIVGQLTGDPDDEVSPQLQDLVGQALARNADDDPLEGF